jgi:hypothetical protein
MASRRQIDPASVTWHAPETIHLTLPDEAEKFAKRVEGAEPAEVIRIANSVTGQFREYLGEEEKDGRIQARFGKDKLVWVNDSPDDTEDPSGHYEVYDGSDEDYRPVVVAGKDD